MAWWETRSGSVLGDEPANILDELRPYPVELADLPDDSRQQIVACYFRDLGREPTEQELCDLLEFCR